MGQIRLTEVGPRDGLQNESSHVSTDAKVAFVDALTDAGHSQIEVSSFVRPDKVPAMADADELFRRIRRAPGVRYIGLVANQRGLARAKSVACDTIALFTATSSSFTQANVGMSVEESLERYRGLCRSARSEGISVRAYVSTIFGCPFEGATRPSEVLRVAEALLDMGCYEVSLGDTTGIGTPKDVTRVLDAVVPQLGAERIALHLHDTWGMAIANVLAGLDYGITHYDASAGGLGGCPFAKGASGNLATEDLLYLLRGMGYTTTPSLEGVMKASVGLSGSIDHPLPSRVYTALRARGDKSRVTHADE